MTLLQIPYLHDMNITFLELVQILIFVITAVGLYVQIKIQYAKLETSTCLKIEALRNEFELRLKAIDSKTVGLSEFLNARLTEFVTANKEDHVEIKKSVDHITSTVNEINIQIARLTSP